MREVALHDNNDDASAFSADSSNSAGTGLYSNDDLDSSVDGDSQAPSSSREELKIAQSEGKFVLCSKFVAYLVLFLSAVAAGIATYHFTRDQEMSEFEDDFKIYAADIARATRASAISKIEVAESLAIVLTSYASDRDKVFPFVTLPDFETRVSKARNLSDSDSIGWVPLVDEAQRTEWEKYAAEKAPEWVRLSMNVTGQTNVPTYEIAPTIHDGMGNRIMVPDRSVSDALKGKYAVFWQGSPVSPINTQFVNADLMREVELSPVISLAVETQTPTISRLLQPNEIMIDQLANSVLAIPVLSDFTDNSYAVGVVVVYVPWQRYFAGLLPRGVKAIDAVLDDSCGRQYTFRIVGPNSTQLGSGDLHNPAFNHMEKTWTLGKMAPTEGAEIHVVDQCVYQLSIYPTQSMMDAYTSKSPVYYAVAVAIIFVFTAGVFLVYDWAVQLRQNKMLKTATRTQAIVSSLFPKNVQERIFKDVEEEVKNDENKGKNGNRFRGNRTKDQLRNFLDDGNQQPDVAKHSSLKSKPIADLFPEATVIFADLVGFTAWSSTREPTQVFTLLENIYHSFDEIAKRRRIFKVETVGDCYVAVSGLPEPRKDHAVAMARFSKDILHKFREMVKQMVVELGPDTEDLQLRVGLHSGPVTAGVLRGERARFQLFGDTMNTTARMESTGRPNRVQLSQETADLLIAAGKTQWLTARDERVNAKGKGELQTYWLDLNDDAAKSTVSGTVSTSGSGYDETAEQAPIRQVPARDHGMPAPKLVADKHMRLISWNTDILARLLTQIIARRESRDVRAAPLEHIKKLEDKVSRTRLVLSEVTEIVNLPQYEANDRNVDPSRIELSEDVIKQLRDYVQTLAAMYRENPFHNFEHASHVTMSVLKLLSRIVAPSDLKGDTDKTLHDHTYGITSDPMTQFAVVLSALIHDADHPGVPNTQLIKENASIAAVYNNKSIAEQNSVDLAWDLLMDDAYADLRRAIYVTEEDFLRFRQLVVNIVLATDIMDKDLGAVRKGRWNKAFSECPLDESPDVSQNRKATIVMEHLIQASDVAHTMQHWHIYRKWNQRLFLEMYKAFREGRSEKDPSESWFEGEKGFFDFYIIPLAKKLKDCGVFGVSSDEYLQYAQQNRKEWELKGAEVVAELLEIAKNKNFGENTEIIM